MGYSWLGVVPGQREIALHNLFIIFLWTMDEVGFSGKTNVLWLLGDGYFCLRFCSRPPFQLRTVEGTLSIGHLEPGTKEFSE